MCCVATCLDPGCARPARCLDPGLARPATCPVARFLPLRRETAATLADLTIPRLPQLWNRWPGEGRRLPESLTRPGRGLQDKASESSDAHTAKGKGCVGSVVPETRVSAISSGSIIDKVLEVGTGSWDRAGVIEALAACNNSPNRAVHILSSENGSETLDALVAKGKGSVRLDAAETSHMATQVNYTVSGSANTSESNINLVLEAGGGERGTETSSPSQSSAANTGPSSPQPPMAKKQKKAKSAGSEPTTDVIGIAPVATQPFDASGGQASSSPSTKPKKEKKVNCSRCKKHRKVCEVDCPFNVVFTTENQSDCEQASAIFGIKGMQTLLAKVTPQDRPQVHRLMMWEVRAWHDDPVRGPLGLLQDLQKKVSALTEQLHQHQQQHQQDSSICRSSRSRSRSSSISRSSVISCCSFSTTR